MQLTVREHTHHTLEEESDARSSHSRCGWQSGMVGLAANPNPVVRKSQMRVDFHLWHVARQALRCHRLRPAQRRLTWLGAVAFKAAIHVEAGITRGGLMRVVTESTIERLVCSEDCLHRILLLETCTLRDPHRGKTNQEFVCRCQFICCHLIGSAMTFPATVDGLHRRQSPPVIHEC